MIERRFVKGQQVKVRSGAKPGIEGYASVFNESYDSGWFIETIKPGAFSRALREKQDVRCLFNHAPDNLLGRTKANTLVLQEDTSGLHYDCELNPDSRVATEVHAMVSRGDLDGCSFAFMVTKQTWREEKEDPADPKSRMVQYRDIEDLDLFDVGPVTYPAYEGTSVGARSLSVSATALWPDGVPMEIRSHVVALRDAKDGDLTDTPSDEGDGDNEDPATEAGEGEECSCRCRACFSGDHEECDDYMAVCPDAQRCGDMVTRAASLAMEQRDDKKTKRVDGEDLPAGSFLYVGDPEKTETWALPWKFSTEEKTVSHLRDALSRFNQTKKIPADKKAGVYKELVAKCNAHGIHVAGEDKKSASLTLEQAKARTETLRASLSL